MILSTRNGWRIDFLVCWGNSGICEENACGLIPPTFFIFPQKCKIKKLKRIALAQAFLWHRTQYVVQKMWKWKAWNAFSRKNPKHVSFYCWEWVRSDPLFSSSWTSCVGANQQCLQTKQETTLYCNKESCLCLSVVIHLNFTKEQ